MWLTRLYPEIAGGDGQTGQRVGWGARQEVDFAHAAYRFHAERVIRKVIERHGDHPAVIGFQVDNEPGLRAVLQHRRLPAVHRVAASPLRDGRALNQEWGLVYWSHRLSRWADLWQPEGNFQPQYDLAWRRFQAELDTEFIGWQADIVREYRVTTSSSPPASPTNRPPSTTWASAHGSTSRAATPTTRCRTRLATRPTGPAHGPLGWVVHGPWAVPTSPTGCSPRSRRRSW